MTEPGTILIILGFLLMIMPSLHLTIGRDRQSSAHRIPLDRSAAAGAALHALYDDQRPSPEIDALTAHAEDALNRVRTNGRRIHH